MKYAQVRIALLTFTLGLSSVPFSDFIQTKWIESSIDLPKVTSTTPIIVYSKYNSEIDTGAGGSGGQTCDDFIKSPGKLTNTLFI